MLSLFPYSNEHFCQQLIVDPKMANRIFKAIEYLDKVARKDVINHLYCAVLNLYRRHNDSGMNEAGVYYGPGPCCCNKDSFPSEMLRLFSLDWQCFNLIAEYYIQLVENNCFYYINSSKIY